MIYVHINFLCNNKIKFEFFLFLIKWFFDFDKVYEILK